MANRYAKQTVSRQYQQPQAAGGGGRLMKSRSMSGSTNRKKIRRIGPGVKPQQFRNAQQGRGQRPQQGVAPVSTVPAGFDVPEVSYGNTGYATPASADGGTSFKAPATAASVAGSGGASSPGDTRMAASAPYSGPPLQPQSEIQRDTAWQNFQNSLSPAGLALYQAALRFGDAGTLRALAADPMFTTGYNTGVVRPGQENPLTAVVPFGNVPTDDATLEALLAGGAMPTLARQKAIQQQQLMDSYNSRGILRSSRTGQGLSQLNDQFGQQESSARSAYNEAFNNFLSQLLSGSGDLANEFGEAAGFDLSEAAAGERRAADQLAAPGEWGGLADDGVTMIPTQGNYEQLGNKVYDAYGKLKEGKISQKKFNTLFQQWKDMRSLLRGENVQGIPENNPKNDARTAYQTEREAAQQQRRDDREERQDDRRERRDDRRTRQLIKRGRK